MKRRSAGFWEDFLDEQALYDGYRPVIPVGGLPIWANPYEEDRENRGPFTAEQILYGLHSEIITSLNERQVKVEKLKYLESLLYKLNLDIVRIHEVERAEVHELIGDYEKDYRPRESAAIDLSIRIRRLIETERAALGGDVVVKPVQKKLHYDTRDTIDRIHAALKDYCPGREMDLMRALSGEPISEPLFFNQEQKVLAEFFRRLKYNFRVVSDSKEVRDWLCTNFVFSYKGELRPFAPTTMYAYLTKGGEAKLDKGRRIAENEWANYRPEES